MDQVTMGADVDALSALARRFQESADQLDRIQRSLSQNVLSAAWRGPVAESFVAAWNGSHRNALTAVVEILRRQAEILASQADAQRGASAPDGAAAPALPEVDLVDPPESRLLWLDIRDAESVETRLPLFDVSGIHPHDVNQGELGDCYLAAALAALAVSPSGQAWLRSRIVDNRDGTFTVHFADGPVTVDDDFYESSNGGPKYARGRNDVWAAVIEEAYAKKYGHFKAIDGGFPDDVFAELGLTGADRDNLEDLSDDEILRILETGNPVTLAGGMGPDAPIQWEKSGRHAFTVTEVIRFDDPLQCGEDRVVIRNPWGNNDGLNVEGVVLNGDGTFTIPLSRVRELFYEIHTAEMP